MQWKQGKQASKRGKNPLLNIQCHNKQVEMMERQMIRQKQTERKRDLEGSGAKSTLNSAISRLNSKS